MRAQRGLVLLVAVVASVALALVAVSVVRAVATGVAVGGNIDARRQAAFAASAALEQDVATLFESGLIDPENDDAGHNYFAARQPGEDERGVPVVLQARANYPAGFGVVDAGDGYVARHVIERLCRLPGEASLGNCTLSPPSVAAASGMAPPSEPPRLPAYRLTIRVDGPAASGTFVQAMLSAAHPNVRLSWRVMDE
ncbi:MAG: hypothetical protein ACM3NZ_09705 [Betaproteobacteria bacterium]|jgi:hypothetical protein